MTIFGRQLTLPKGRSFLVNLAKKAEIQPLSHSSQNDLSGAPCGSQVQVTGFHFEIPAERRNQLLAYGLTNGARVQVMQHSPVTVIRIDHTELALESGLAKQVQISSLANSL